MKVGLTFGINCVTLKLELIGTTRIHLSTERWRVCETWFSPSMAGVDSAGLGEVIQNILARFSEAEKGRLVKVSLWRQTIEINVRPLLNPFKKLTS